MRRILRHHVIHEGPLCYPPGMSRVRKWQGTVPTLVHAHCVAHCFAHCFGPLLHRQSQAYRIPPLFTEDCLIPRRCFFDIMMSRRGDQSDRVGFPPLPKLYSQKIQTQVFTHRSFYGRPTHVFEDQPGDLSPDNERFEHLGDTVLGLIVTALMMDMYPGLHVGPATKIRSMIVRNTTLAEISRSYRLHERLLLHPAQEVTLRASVHIQADVFEAFVGGLYKDQGIEAVRAWLMPLFRHYVTKAYTIIRQQYGLPPVLLPTPDASPPPSSPSSIYSIDPPTAPSESPPTPPPATSSALSPLALFNQHISKTNRHVEWIYSDGAVDKLADAMAASSLGTRRRADNRSEESPINRNESRSALEFLGERGNKSTPVWIARVIVDGELFGAGRGNTKKIARNEAAKRGLEKLGVALVL